MQIVDVNCSVFFVEIVVFEYLLLVIGIFMSMICLEDFIMVGIEIFYVVNLMGIVILFNVVSSGCDSIVNVIIDFFVFSVFDLSMIICLEDILSVGGVDFYINNLIGQVILDNVSVNGCDSMVNVNLNFFLESIFLFVMIVCSNDIVIVGIDDYYFGNVSGISIFIDVFVNGCDSIVNVDLSFFLESSFMFNLIICNDDIIIVGIDFYYFGNFLGMIILEDVVVNGCDSIVLVDL